MITAPTDVPVHRASVGAMALARGSQMPALDHAVSGYVYGASPIRLRPKEAYDHWLIWNPETDEGPEPKPKPKPKRRKARPRPRPKPRRYVPPPRQEWKPEPIPDEPRVFALPAGPPPEPIQRPARPIRTTPGWVSMTLADLEDW